MEHPDHQDHLYSMPRTPRPTAESVIEKLQRAGEITTHKKLLDEMRGRTRVNIGAAFPRWRTLRTRLGIRKDSDLALVLLDSFYKTRVPQAPSVRPRKRSRDDQQNSTSSSGVRHVCTESKDTWETASEDEDEDCVASICLRLRSRPGNASDVQEERTELQ